MSRRSSRAASRGGCGGFRERIHRRDAEAAEESRRTIPQRRDELLCLWMPCLHLEEPDKLDGTICLVDPVFKSMCGGPDNEIAHVCDNVERITG